MLKPEGIVALAISAAVGTLGAGVSEATLELKRLESEVVQQKLRAAGVEPKIGTPEQVKKMLEERTPEWAEVIKSANIRAEGR